MGGKPSVTRVVKYIRKGEKGDKGDKGDNGTSFTVKGVAQAHYSSYSAMTSASGLTAGKIYLYDDGTEAGASTYNGNNSWTAITSANGDGYLIGDTKHLWVKDGTKWNDLGEIQGPKGDSAPYVELSRTSVLYSADNDGDATSEQSFEVTLYLKVGGQNCTISSVNSISVSSLDGVTATKDSTSKITLTVANNAQPSGVIAVQVTGILNGITYTALAGITIEPNRKGDTGDAAVEYSVSLAGSTFARDPETETIYVDIKGTVYKTVGGNQQAYGSLSRNNLSMYFLKTDGTTDSVPNINSLSDGYTVSGSTFASKFYNNTGYAGEQVFVVELNVGGHTAKASLQITKYGDKGPTGSEGESAPYVELSRNTILYSANNSGYSTASQNFEIDCYLKVKGNTCSISGTGSISIASITNVSVTKNSTSKITVNIPHSKIIAGVITVQMTGTYDNKSYTAKATISVEPNREGAEGPEGPEGPQGPQGPQGGTGGTGPRGYRGPGLRGPQDWEQMDIDYQFYQGDENTQEPYEDFVVYHGNYYKCIKTHVKTSTNYPGSTYDNNNHLWQLSDKVAMVAANVLFAKHGYFGGAIISGDWLISANGMVDNVFCSSGESFQGVIAYSLFNENNPSGGDILIYGSSETKTVAVSDTIKNITTVNLKSGKMYFLKVKGRASSSSGQYYVRLRNVEDTSITHTPVMINGTSDVTRQGYFHPTKTGDFYLEFYNPGVLSGTVTSVELIEKDFAPTFALDLLTGTTYQHDGVFTGFIRKGKTVITTSNINNYKRADITADTVLDFDKCGSFIELSTGTQSYFAIPILSNYYASKYTEAQKDNMRAFVGTKIMVYNKTGATLNIHLNSYFSTTDKSSTGGVTSNSTAIGTGGFIILECKLKGDPVNGDENVYWEELGSGTIV